jgi:hypothetical protein
MTGGKDAALEYWNKNVEEEVAVPITKKTTKKNTKPTPPLPPAKTISEMLAESTKEADEKARLKAEKAAKAAEEAARKAAEAEEKERLRIEKEIAQERERLLKAEMKAYQRDLTKAHQVAVEEEAFARERLAAAEAQERQAWGWYRDRDSWKAQLAEERAEAEAQKQFELDFKSLRSRRLNWRSAKLNDDDELIRRVALAKEEKARAEEYAKITAEATKEAAERLEQIESYFAQGGE